MSSRTTDIQILNRSRDVPAHLTFGRTNFGCHICSCRVSFNLKFVDSTQINLKALLLKYTRKFRFLQKFIFPNGFLRYFIRISLYDFCCAWTYVYEHVRVLCTQLVSSNISFVSHSLLMPNLTRQTCQSTILRVGLPNNFPRVLNSLRIPSSMQFQNTCLSRFFEKRSQL